MSAESKRKPNFSEAEDSALIENYFLRQKIIEGSFSKDLTTKDKQKAWREIADAVNSVDDRCVREPGEMQARIRNMMRDYKEFKRQTNYPPTGGGKKPQEKRFFQQLDSHMCDDTRIIGVSAVPVELGIGESSRSFSPSPSLTSLPLASSSLATSGAEESEKTFATLTPIAPKYEQKKRKIILSPRKESGSGTDRLGLLEKQLSVLQKQERNLEIEHEVLVLQKQIAELKLERSQHANWAAGEDL